MPSFRLPEQSPAVFLDGAAWLQVVRSQNSGPPLLRDPQEKQRPHTGRGAEESEKRRRRKVKIFSAKRRKMLLFNGGLKWIRERLVLKTTEMLQLHIQKLLLNFPHLKFH